LKKEVIHPTNAWKFEHANYEKHVAENRLYWGRNGENTYPRLKKFLSEMEGGMVPVDLWRQEETGTTDQGSKELEDLLGGKYFDFPKPVSLIKRALSLMINDSDAEGIYLDFFAGTSPTAQAIMELNKNGGNRKFICVQLPEPCDPKSEAYKAGYSTIADISKERIRRAGAKLRAEIDSERAQKASELSFDNTDETTMPDFGFKVFRLAESNFKQWRDIRGSEQQQWQQQSIDFINPVAENATIDNMVYELLLKNGKNLNSTIEHSNNYYNINSGELILLLESVDQATIDHILTLHPQKVIALDNLFSGNDQLKTNTVLQLRDAGIEFKTI
jgi:adenine-specific DNA-methyltransferase